MTNKQNEMLNALPEEEKKMTQALYNIALGGPELSFRGPSEDEHEAPHIELARKIAFSLFKMGLHNGDKDRNEMELNIISSEIEKFIKNA